MAFLALLHVLAQEDLSFRKDILPTVRSDHEAILVSIKQYISGMGEALCYHLEILLLFV